MRLKGKVAIVTGAASGLGKAIARRYAEEGVDLVLADMNIELARAVADELSAAGSRAVAQQTDVASEESVRQMVDAALAAFGRIDILVNNAGLSTLRLFLDLPVAEWDHVMGVNLRGPFLCSQMVGRHMAERRDGTIINVTSIEQDFGSHNRAHYVSSKGGLKTLTKAMALSFAPYGVRVNAIAPGGFNTEILEKTFPDVAVREAFVADFVKKIPMKRLGEPREIAGAAVFLASEDASYMTGSVIDVNGGASSPVPSDP
ncbi:glucose 1-dehydrogenase [Sphingomonas histidinilytica]|jgi:3-oxoacyl-[acyl-carrier protein] reductase|uniref:3-oxoacyl-[acyl-carrier protein] reductase n=1 Tax=Rhizorhabdus histidinilytica TaxID=439228 RepID=A0A1T5EPW8_9SPHN|nr:glucose 1-dehydrogenase [Rhizorhabdus histidinilytica]MBO9376683.1 glucose 1-dehydrogenase [Rhizorhabdus histidinilytica]QEH76871.1 glucose 1-dehydrogenase [Sphingomonas sp. C8-2]SKB85956.1 3-oxoacyl-[acyl-carrier protein] reductase [Rhizorhabdus histidinilytica]